MTATAAKSNPIADLRRSLIANGYKYVPVKGKVPVIKGWQKFRQDATQVEGVIRKHEDHTNTGILAGEVVAIDIDIPDPATCERVIELLLTLPGSMSAPYRVGRAPKCLYIFRTDSPRTKAATAGYTVDGAKCQVEVLGNGQQFVAFGVHPDTGREYEWSNGNPLDVAV
jgi:Bifunctional DNA primase/polymerase, N-terminal